MAYANSLMDGARLAFFVSLQLAIVNGLWRRFSPSGNTLTTAVNDRIGTSSGGMS